MSGSGNMKDLATLAAKIISKRRRGARLVRTPGRAHWKHRSVSFKPGQEGEAIQTLAKDVAKRHMVLFMELPILGTMAAGVTAGATIRGVAVRACCQYDLFTDKTFSRLDVLGAALPRVAR